MTTDTNIFGSEKPADQQAATTPTTTEDKGLFAALVGDKQKYKSPEDLAKAYTNADAFIEQLKEENRKLREAQAQAKTLDDVLERINQTKTRTQDDTPAATVDPSTIADLVEKTLTGREAAKVRDTNLFQADKLMKEKFGEKAGEVFKSKATTPQLQKVYMELASTDPMQFVAMFANEQVPQTAAVDMGSVSGVAMPTATNNRATVEGTREWAAKVRKEDPSKYWSADFQYKLQQATIKNPKLYFGN